MTGLGKHTKAKATGTQAGKGEKLLDPEAGTATDPRTSQEAMDYVPRTNSWPNRERQGSHAPTRRPPGGREARHAG